MLPVLELNQNVFIEISNLQHGGLGWEFGSCLWSPEKNKANQASWKLMEEIKEGDIILHFAKVRNNQNWYGLSVVSSSLKKGLASPTIPGKWVNLGPYQRVNLTYFQPLTKPLPAKDLFSRFYTEFVSLLPHRDSFYFKSPSDESLKIQQRYIANCPTTVYELFNILSNEIGFTPVFNTDDAFYPSIAEPLVPDYTPPGRVQTSISRIIRDTKLSRDVKEKYGRRCQICGLRIPIASGGYYAEAHHIKPLGGIFQGPDTLDNLIVLCPTHHAEFDFGSIAIDPFNDRILHIDHANEFHGRVLAYHRSDLKKEFLLFHLKERFDKK
jgi:hypothetical protein